MEYGHIIEGALAALGMGGTYLVGRKRTKAETRKIEASATINEMEATEKAVAIWRGLAQELRNEVDQLRKLVNELRKEIDELKRQNSELKEEMSHYKSKENA